MSKTIQAPDDPLVRIAKSRPPICPSCGREMVFSVMCYGVIVLMGWLCDCLEQADGVSADIANARRTGDQVLFYDIAARNNEAQDDIEPTREGDQVSSISE